MSFSNPRQPLNSEPPDFSDHEPADKTSVAPSVTDLAATVAELRRDLRKSLAWSQIIHQQNKRIQRRLTMMTLANYFRLFFLLLPFVIAAIYLPPIIRRAIDLYNTITTTTTNAISTPSLQNVRSWLQTTSTM